LTDNELITNSMKKPFGPSIQILLTTYGPRQQEDEWVSRLIVPGNSYPVGVQTKDCHSCHIVLVFSTA
jgi:hypothetical protein